MLLVLTIGQANPQGQTAQQPDTPAVDAARRFVELFVAKDAGLQALMNEKLAAAFGAKAATTAADQIAAKGGRFVKIDSASAERAGDYMSVTVRANYERLGVDYRVAIDGAGRVAGFVVAKMVLLLPWQSPPYAKAGTWLDEPVTVDAGGWPLPGTLSVPKGKGPFPLAVLVHGSGPEDRDETIGPNKPFADIAQGLASRGIAVLRYDKRTLVYGERMAASASTLGVKEEVVDDALAALALGEGDSRIDPGRVFLIGHSQGAWLGPMIAATAAAKGLRLAGLVLIAPNARPLEDVVVDQVRYLAKIGAAGPDADKTIAALEAAAARVKRLGKLRSKDDPPPAELPLGVPASWWRSVAGYDAPATARNLGLPLLVIHGSRDYQVNATEAGLWRKGLAGDKDATLRIFEGLSHLMMPVAGTPSPSDYDNPGHVDRDVVQTIGDFVLKSR